ncbi:Protein of unknown function DUF4054 [uncultured Caudovirales phage]|uniref:Uncharacterized protein n=1 Tax=uncultured Caudovirales phage TaxID=2100421 RepID=A0A6J7WC26_9CAUD|nr:Protein of unknown function DUF4054 [uncultured Caudovirales phage]
MSQHTFDVTAFRAMFPEFSNVTTYPDAALNGYWTMGVQHIYSYDNDLIDGDTLQLALNLMAAHLGRSFSLVNTGNTPSVMAGATEGSVGVSMSPPPFKTGWQYWLSTTPYGVQLWALLQSLVVGGLYIGSLPERYGFRKIGGIF